MTSPEMTSPEVASPEMTSPEMMSPEVNGNDATGTENERKIISRAFFSPGFCRVFSKTSLDSMYGQWNGESNLYRVTRAITPYVKQFFSLLNCAVSRD